MAARSLQSDPRTAQSGYGRFTRRPVLWGGSGTVKMSFGNGAVSRRATSKSACTAASWLRDDFGRIMIVCSRCTGSDVPEQVIPATESGSGVPQSL